MKFWVVLVAATLLGGCGAEPLPPEAPPTTTPPPPGKFWGYLDLWGGVTENVTTRIFEGVPLVRKMHRLLTQLSDQTTLLKSQVKQELLGVRDRAAEYVGEVRGVLDQTWLDLQNRGGSYGRKLRKRLLKDQEDLKKRWERLGKVWEEGLGSLRQSWGAPLEPQGL